jgi:crotonobetainyl-CoA:carnitine CoA-transferase CaiB-like acyl-CoA transferase
MSKLQTICGVYNFFPRNYGPWTFNTDVFNTEDTYMCILGVMQHHLYDRFVEAVQKLGIKINTLYDDTAVNSYEGHDQTSNVLRQKIVVFEFSFIPNGLNSGNDKIHTVPTL